MTAPNRLARGACAAAVALATSLSALPSHAEFHLRAGGGATAITGRLESTLRVTGETREASGHYSASFAGAGAGGELAAGFTSGDTIFDLISVGLAAYRIGYSAVDSRHLDRMDLHLDPTLFEVTVGFGASFPTADAAWRYGFAGAFGALTPGVTAARGEHADDARVGFFVVMASLGPSWPISGPTTPATTGARHETTWGLRGRLSAGGSLDGGAFLGIALLAEIAGP